MLGIDYYCNWIDLYNEVHAVISGTQNGGTLLSPAAVAVRFQSVVGTS